MHLGKYWAVFQVSAQTSLTYRASSFLWVVIEGLSLVGPIFLWLAVFAVRPTLAGFTRDSMVSYYLALFILNQVFTTANAGNIERDIRRGELSGWLLRPISYLKMRFVFGLGFRLYRPLLLSPILLLALYWGRNYLQVSSELITWLLTLTSVALGLAVLVGIHYSLALLAFWVSSVGHLRSFLFMALGLLGGRMAPIDLFPALLRKIILALPFRYTYSLPLEIYFERLTKSQLMQGLAAQAVWAILLLWLVRFLWRRGVAAYQAYGA